MAINNCADATDKTFRIKAAEWETNSSPGAVIAVGSRIPFDTLMFDNTNGGIIFDADTELFTIKGPSVWQILWDLPVTSATGAVVNLMANAAIVLAVTLPSGEDAGLLHGGAIVALPNPTNLVSLVVAGASLTMNNTPSTEQATISFLRIM